MATKPTQNELAVLIHFLDQALRIRQFEPPPPPPPPPAAQPMGLLAAALYTAQNPITPPPGLFAIGDLTLRGLLGPTYATTFSEFMGKDYQAPFEATEHLPQDRQGRIAQLHAWLERFPAVVWIKKQEPIKNSLIAFENIQKKRANDPSFRDDLAQFRLWRFFAYGVMFLDAKHWREPDSDEKAQARAAAKKLLRLAQGTNLLVVAGVTYQDQSSFEQALEKLTTLDSSKRRKREDESTPFRDFVHSLCLSASCAFTYIPPKLICEMAALKKQNVDETAIKKMVSEFKDELKTKKQ